ncbi:MAG: hypothetical protein KIS91_06420 [Anaerolineae bacterium]|nr:hypothetical protein [Anaerolineae bacterium]
MSAVPQVWTRPPLVLREAERLDAALDPAEVAALRACPLVDVAPAWTPGHYTLTARALVGRAALPRRWLAVQPKTPVPNLFAMLAATARLPRWSDALTAHSGGDDLLAGLVHLYAAALADYLAGGPRRATVDMVEAAPVVRGKLLLAPTLRQSPSLRHRPITRRGAWSLDTPAHRLLKQAARIAQGLALTDAVHRGLDVSLARLVDVADVDTAEDAFDRLTLSRLDGPALPALNLARWLVAGVTPTLAAGRRLFPAFCFDVGHLFEAFVAHLVTDGLSDARVTAQRHTPLDRDQRVWLRPDLVVTRAGRPVVVLDTKYKLAATPDTPDLYQLATYCQALGVTHGVLVYPAPATTPPLVLQGGVTLHSLSLDLGVSPAALPAACAAFVEAMRCLAQG